jgi:putative glutamine amidotransferase
MKDKLTIGISDCGAKHPNYENWIKGADAHVEVIKLGYTLNNLDELAKCDALLLTGGHDLNPNLYGKPEYMDDCQVDNMDNGRDRFEIALLENAIAANKPVLGICRGLQLSNAFFKGTLVADLPKYKSVHHSAVDGIDREHTILVEPGTLMAEIAGVANGEINSAHHQSTDAPGNGLRINAYSGDGVVEGLEWAEPKGKPFLFLVQWHPERLKDKENSPFSNNIRTRFLQEAEKYSHENS